MKICSKCLVAKPFADFYRYSRSRDGYRTTCKPCWRALCVAGIKAWRVAHPEKVQTYRRNWAERNPEKARESSQQWAAKNPVKVRERIRRGQHRRRIRSIGVVCDLTFAQWQEIVEFYGHRCAYCRKGGDLTQDHIVPVSKGGPHTAWNILPLCRPCNSSKGNRVDLEIAFQPHPYIQSHLNLIARDIEAKQVKQLKN